MSNGTAEFQAFSPGEETSEIAKNNPSAFLSQITGAKVAVKLNSGVEYRGDLQCVDGYMNIALEQTEEYVDGILKNQYGDVFIRGNNVLYISSI
ncbi:hypothetical protein POJ06DRAFT_262463 [Lipomyces tetrasporus]|uniref:Sm domain-containing protein n=1 Tax=Lipomyces tetrasporus TaxID=54092 RepID=A0AAD7QKV0_9ASCO|nr:uncharacterized protein POJ06DRAFT_262463 [Lipomyces tetrasporus]KAJ8097081.1 hypothetical protein POJ06DRAFT_262463 [Lipomyces tetrasporus]